MNLYSEAVILGSALFNKVITVDAVGFAVVVWALIVFAPIFFNSSRSAFFLTNKKTL